jgi:hypothetical protein
VNSDDFISVIVKCVHEAAVNDTISVLAEGPSGRKPPALLVELSAWFNELPKADRERLHQVVEQAVHSALFGVFCVVDGVRPIDNSDEKTKFQLLASRQGESKLLNTEDGEYLHDTYHGKVYERVFGREP